jgi:hypothetical protein
MRFLKKEGKQACVGLMKDPETAGTAPAGDAVWEGRLFILSTGVRSSRMRVTSVETPPRSTIVSTGEACEIQTLDDGWLQIPPELPAELV